MITSLRGRLEAAGPDWIEIAVGGVTLKVNVPGSDVERLARQGAELRLFTSLQVREDSFTLFGFSTREARSAFEALIGISGIGPRVALSVLSLFTPASLALAVASGDTDAFVGVPGVGKRTASRIVLELAGKIDEISIPASTAVVAQDIVDALTAIGYSVAEARESASGLPSDDGASLEERVREALQRMASR